MATLHNKITDSGVFVRWRSNPDLSRPSTYQVTEQAVSLLSDLGYSVPQPGDEEEIPWEVCRPLRLLGDLYFKSDNHGDVDTGQVGNIDESYAQDLTEAQRRRLKNYITEHENYTNSDEKLKGEISALSSPSDKSDDSIGTTEWPEEGQILAAEINRVSSSGNGLIEVDDGHINIGPVKENSVGEAVTIEAVTKTFAICVTESIRSSDYASEFWKVDRDMFHKLGRPSIDTATFCEECGSAALKKTANVYICGICETEFSPERQDADSSNGATELDILKAKAVADSTESVSYEEEERKQEIRQYNRSSAVKQYVKARADGFCEGCDEFAPFISKTGEPYLQTHHIKELSDGGSDTPDNVIALCPNCHYRVHHGEDGDEYNQELLEVVQEKENSNE